MTYLSHRLIHSVFKTLGPEVDLGLDLSRSCMGVSQATLAIR
ncbi:hypothetical protein [Marivita sp. S6314]|nr:hypothetical protein [Marivita sp. S6314]